MSTENLDRVFEDAIRSYVIDEKLEKANKTIGDLIFLLFHCADAVEGFLDGLPIKEKDYKVIKLRKLVSESRTAIEKAKENQ